MNKRLKKLLVLSIWEEIWSLGEGSGVADELHFIRYLSEKGVEIHFLIPEPAGKGGILNNPRLACHTYPNIFRSFRRLPNLLKRFLHPAFFPWAVLKRLKELATEIEPDLLLGFTHHCLYPLNRIGGELGIPTAVKMFGVMYLDRFDLSLPRYWWNNLDQRLALRHQVDHYIVLNDGTRGMAALTRLGIPRERISFLPNGMDTEWADIPVDREEVRNRMGLPLGDILVVTFSRLVKSKRINIFLEAASMVNPALLGRITFVIGGSGPEGGRLERLARRLGLEGKVIFTGVIPHSEIPSLLKASDIFVGTNELTNMSLPPCEAILCGVPVVAFDVSGTSEVVRDGETGLLASDGDTEGLAKKLELLIGDDGLRKRLGSNAAEFGRRHFVSWNERIEMELGALDGILQSRTKSLKQNSVNNPRALC